MNADVQVSSKAASGLMSVVVVGFLGAALVFVAGFANSSVMHDAAHDTRHSTGFPCH
ncbi:MAG: CbtB domain-containing protein [Alphaproteobacteria bacterium]|jgi:cobalt transporter subunit CbtB